MENIVTEVTALSSKGQIVLPKSIRESLSLKSGTKLIVFADGDNILLKPIIAPNKKEFNKLMKASKKWANDVGMKEKDISDAIKEVRKRKNK